MRKTLILFFLMALIMAFGGCTITHEFGPYSGKVVDAQTGEPIEGAVVLMSFYNMGTTVGGPTVHFVDAVEAFTGTDGEFKFPPKRITLFKVMRIWDKKCRITIFKPGYGSYPGNKKTYGSPKQTPSWSLSRGNHVTFHLPELKTLQERKNNLFDIREPAGIPVNKMSNLQMLQSKERINVGLSP